MKRWARRVPSGFENSKPFHKIELGAVGGKRHRPPNEKRNKDRYFQAVRIKNGIYAEAAILRCQFEAFPYLAATANILRWLYGINFGSVVVPDV